MVEKKKEMTRNVSPRGGTHSPLVFNAGGDGDAPSLLTIQIDKQAQIMTNFKHFFFPIFLNTKKRHFPDKNARTSIITIK